MARRYGNNVHCFDKDHSDVHRILDCNVGQIDPMGKYTMAACCLIEEGMNSVYKSNP
jgi:hypothetical protein